MPIKTDFYRFWDRSLMLNDLKNSRHFGQVGKGRHFEALLWTRSDYGFVVCRARSEFLDGLQTKRRQWLDRIHRTSRLSHPLIPPMEAFFEGEDLFYVKPYCEEALAVRPYSSELASLTDSLRAEGLVVDDYWQMRARRGQPFVIDWSDLMAV
ncbi:MAG: hypothetical protein HRU19_17720 [Pseudobacteriovorax sp.]|nr:hypothetical protein [Pseudobacteriovorax sp.]